jgi:hypothetical protein
MAMAGFRANARRRSALPETVLQEDAKASALL